MREPSVVQHMHTYAGARMHVYTKSFVFHTCGVLPLSLLHKDNHKKALPRILRLLCYQKEKLKKELPVIFMSCIQFSAQENSKTEDSKCSHSSSADNLRLRGSCKHAADWKNVGEREKRE